MCGCHVELNAPHFLLYIKEVKNLIDISANEAKILRKKGRGCDVHMSSRSKGSRGKRYFLTESFKSMKILNEYRNSRIISSGDVNG